MKFSKVQFVYIDIDYLKAMNEADSEIFYDENNKEYKFKPHLGMLITAVEPRRKAMCALYIDGEYVMNLLFLVPNGSRSNRLG